MAGFSQPLKIVVFFATAVVIGVVAFFYANPIVDSIKASQFQPSSQVSEITHQLELTSRGKDVFFASQPSVESRAQFNNSCKSAERRVAILGCYSSGRIYVFDVTDSQLDGAMGSTSAHELLHAAYAGLNYFDRQEVNKMLQKQYDKIKEVPEIKEAMQYYRQVEPGEELNELHSIIGVSIASIDPELESYYARYFNNRSNIVKLNDRYMKVFSDQSALIDQLERQLKDKKEGIEQSMSKYEQELASLDRDIKSFNQRANSDYFKTRAQFDNERNALVNRERSLNQTRTNLTQDIDSYNKLTEEYNSQTVRSNQLYKNINGVAEVPSL